MSLAKALTSRSPDAALGTIIKLAVMAVGGQGGGVLTAWIEATARASGYAVQATSVAGVSQRTGATIYYIEMAPPTDRAPVFSLAPAAGDVDILIASEMMEVGRAILRGFVTPDRTLLIGSTHRALAVSEKTVPGDGIANPEEVHAAAEIAAARLILADMEALAVAQGSIISASLFGALAGSGALPFPRAGFEAAIRASGTGVEASLRAFAAGFDAVSNPAQAAPVAVPKPAPPQPKGAEKHLAGWHALTGRIAAMPEAMQEMARAGVQKVADFQDIAYGAEYLDRLDAVLALDDPSHDHMLSREAAKYIANAMAYDDVIRVADLKTRAPRFERIRAEMRADPSQALHLTEFMHPRAEEIAGMMPARMGARTAANPHKMARLDRWFNKGRRLRTDRLHHFLMLYVLGGLRRWRRGNYRHSVEQAHLDGWLNAALAYLPGQYDLAVEVLRCRRLIKGYSDTHARGHSKYDRVLEGIALVAGRKDAAEWAARLREAALKDEAGAALDGALLTVRSFA